MDPLGPWDRFDGFSDESYACIKVIQSMVTNKQPTDPGAGLI